MSSVLIPTTLLEDQDLSLYARVVMCEVIKHWTEEPGIRSFRIEGERRTGKALKELSKKGYMDDSYYENWKLQQPPDWHKAEQQDHSDEIYAERYIQQMLRP